MHHDDKYGSWYETSLEDLISYTTTNGVKKNNNTGILRQYADGQWTADMKGYGAKIEGIKANLSSYSQLFALQAVVDAHNNVYGPIPYLVIGSLIGGRSDRRKNLYSSFDLKPVCDMINRMGFKHVYVLEPHSDVTLALIDNSEFMFFNWWDESIKTVVAPDAGAYKRVSHQIEELKYNVNLIGAMKYRDQDGVPFVTFTGNVQDVNCVIVDDLCDGGRTFIQLRKQIVANGGICDTLVVTHGLFTYGLEPLVDAGITNIYTTNTYNHSNLVIPAGCNFNEKKVI